MFKVNWEKTQTTHHLADGLIKQMLSSHYDMHNIKGYRIINGGCANVNILVDVKNSNPQILRIYLREQNSAHKEWEISKYLNGKIPVPEFYYIDKISSYTFAITKYIPGITLREYLLNNPQNNIGSIMFDVGQMLGQISKFKFPEISFASNEPAITEKSSHSKMIEFALNKLNTQKISSFLSIKQMDKISKILLSNKTLIDAANESNLVHADFDPSNILVEEKNGKVKISGILDWEFSFSGSSLFDVASMLRYAHHLPNNFETSFIKGLNNSRYKLDDSWQIIIKLLNLISLIDCLDRSDIDRTPNRVADIKSLMTNIIERI